MHIYHEVPLIEEEFHGINKINIKREYVELFGDCNQYYYFSIYENEIRDIKIGPEGDL